MQFPTEPVQRDGETDRYLVPMSVGVRAIAYIIDTFLFALITIIVLYAFDAVDALTRASTFTYTQLIIIGAQCGYFFVFEAVFGWTPGKRVFQMRVVHPDGSRCGVVGSFVRNLIRPIDVLFFGVIGAMSILSGFKRQRLGDRAAHTLVVRPVPLPFVPPPYVPADKPQSRRCPRCGALAESGQQKCQVCGFDLDSKPQAQWPFGIPGFPMPGQGRPQQGAGAAGEPGEEDYVEDEDYVEEEPGEEAGAGAEPGAQRRPAAQPGGANAPNAPTFPFGMPAPPAGATATDLAADLYDEDTDSRLYAGREILMEGDKDDVQELARAVREWEASDREFIVNIARTLDGWRPVLVLEALRNDPDEEVAAGAREALATVTERNEREERERAAWEAARAGRLEEAEEEELAPEDELEDEESPEDDELPEDELHDEESPEVEPPVEEAEESPAGEPSEDVALPPAPEAPEAPSAPAVGEKPKRRKKSK